MAIDYGQKRTGIAVTDDLKIIASGLTTVNTNELISFLKSYTTDHQVELILVGEPKRMNNEASEVEKLIKPLIEELHLAFPEISVERVDERFTSKMAFQTMIDAGISKKKRQNKTLIDEISATLILQSYLYSKS